MSAVLTVESRCAMTIVVRPCIARSNASWTTCSLSASSADVASSRSRIRGDKANARAMAIRCFCPPDSLTPRSPTNVSYPSGKVFTNSAAFASAAQVCIASSVRLPPLPSGHSERTAVSRLTAAAVRHCRRVWRAQAMLYRMLPSKSTGSCCTSAIIERSHIGSIVTRSRPSIVIVPDSGR